MKIYLRITFLLPVLLFISCGTKKNSETTELELVELETELEITPVAPTPPPDNAQTYVGVIALDEECGHVIKVQLEDGQELSFAPNNLNDLYKKPGMRVRFSTLSQLDEEKKCGEHYQINLERITPLRE